MQFQNYYDPLYRLTKATGRELTNLWGGTPPAEADFANSIICPNPATNAMQNYSQEITYDDIGNITEMKSVGDWIRNYIYNGGMANNYLEGHNSSGEYDYDKHGNCIKMPHLATIDWDYRDRLKEADLGGGGTAYYTYDAGGERISKVVDNGGGLIKKTIYLGGYEVYREIISGTIDKERETVHLNDDKRRVALVQTLTIDAGVPVGSPTEVIKYQLDNHLGSACLELDTSANVISFEEYHPFGVTSYRSGSSSAEVSLKKYKYVGKERDDETGLYYYGARYYAAWVGRWISADPLGMVDGPNLYAYVKNNPVNLIDSFGMQAGVGNEDDQAYTVDKYGDISGIDPRGNKLKFGQGTIDQVASADSKIYGFSVKDGGDFLWTGTHFTEISKGALKNLSKTESGSTFLDMLVIIDNMLSQGGAPIYGNAGSSEINTGRSIPSQNMEEGIDVTDLLEAFSNMLKATEEGDFSQEDKDAVKHIVKSVSENLKSYQSEMQAIHPDDVRLNWDIESVLENFSIDNSIKIEPNKVVDSLDVEYLQQEKSGSSRLGYGPMSVKDTARKGLHIINIRATKYKNDSIWQLNFQKN